MTVAELSKKYEVSKQSVYVGIDRHHYELIGHISENEHGHIVIDEVAADILKPKYISAEKYNKVCERNFVLENDNKALREELAVYGSDVNDLKNQLFQSINTHENDLQNMSRMIGEKDERIKALNNLLEEKSKVITELETIIKEKDNRIADLERDNEHIREQSACINELAEEYRQKAKSLEDELAAAKTSKGFFGIGKR